MAKVFYLFTVATYVQTSVGYMVADEHANEKVLFSTFEKAHAHLLQQIYTKNVIDTVLNWHIFDIGKGVAVCDLWSDDKCVYLRLSVEPIELLR